MTLLASGLAMGESPRWHNGRLWLSDWGSQEILAIDLQGNRQVMARVPFALPFCLAWLPEPDGRLLIVAGREARVVRVESDGSFVTHADLKPVSAGPWNEIVVDACGNIYVNASGAIALVTPDGSVRRVGDGGAFPNGMAITPDNSTLILAESYARVLTAFDIAPDGSLSNRRIWADLAGGVPDGIALDSEGAVWYADVPNKRCVRVREGGEVLETVDLDRGCFSCALGGPLGNTLFVVASEWRGMENVAAVAEKRTGQVIAVELLSKSRAAERLTVELGNCR